MKRDKDSEFEKSGEVSKVMGTNNGNLISHQKFFNLCEIESSKNLF